MDDYLEKIAEQAFYDELDMMEKDAYIGTALKAGKKLVRRGLDTGIGKQFANSNFGKSAIKGVRDFGQSGVGQSIRGGLKRGDTALRDVTGRVANTRFGSSVAGAANNLGLKSTGAFISRTGLNSQRNAARLMGQ